MNVNSVVFGSIANFWKNLAAILFDFQWIKHKGFKNVPVRNVLILSSEESIYFEPL